MTMEYVRTHYKVPAKRGGRIRYTHGGIFYGTITGARGNYLRVRWDEGNQRPVRLHPTWCIEYLAPTHVQHSGAQSK